MCCFVPDEGLWILVVVVDEAGDGIFKFLGGAVISTPEWLIGQGGELALDQVGP